ncbi:MAG: 30S ribosomal protein S3 [Bacilli bacterium]|jgi:small subunit ribosomal protein S3|nr:30S ribosomal protein S3 [Bacilli bacterium]
MGQKVNPNGMRIGINKDWSSRWYASDKDYAKYIALDMKIRNYLEPKLVEAELSHIDIERIKGTITVSIFVARPGVVIGQDGANIKNLKDALLKLIGVDDIKLNIVEIKDPNLDAVLVAKSIAKQLEERASFRIAQKKAIQNIIRAGAKGCKTMVKGRLGGAEIARSESYREGTLSLQTLSQNVDYGFAEAKTTYGRLGVKVWIALPANFAGNVLAPGEKRAPSDRFDRRGPRRPFNNGPRQFAPRPAVQAAPVPAEGQAQQADDDAEKGE